MDGRPHGGRIDLLPLLTHDGQPIRPKGSAVGRPTDSQAGESTNQFTEPSDLLFVEWGNLSPQKRLKEIHVSWVDQKTSRSARFRRTSCSKNAGDLRCSTIHSQSSLNNTTSGSSYSYPKTRSPPDPPTLSNPLSTSLPSLRGAPRVPNSIAGSLAPRRSSAGDDENGRLFGGWNEVKTVEPRRT